MFFEESENEQVKEVRHSANIIVDVVLQIKFPSPTKICYTDAILQGTTWLSFITRVSRRFFVSSDHLQQPKPQTTK